MASLMRGLIGACVLAALAAGCGGSSASRERGGASARSFQAGEIRLDALDPQPLESGACGMFLWAHAAQQPIFVFAAFADPAEAHVRQNGRDRVLARTAVEGEAQHGHFETQTFSDSRLTLTVEVHFDRQRGIQDGAAIERGVIRITDRDGWETIIPVGGMVGCQP